MTPGIKNVLPDNIRDLRIMARRGMTFRYIRDVFGWSDKLLQELCAVHGIAIKDAPAPPPVPASPVDVRNLSVRHAKAARQQLREAVKDHPGARRKPKDQVRSACLGVVTTPALYQTVKLQAARRNISNALFLHLLLAAIAARDLWAKLLDSDSVPVASASHQNHNNERR